ncbi:MAG: hypothetical protein ACR2MO_08545 [Acidimicrobiales bacterium]
MNDPSRRARPDASLAGEHDASPGGGPCLDCGCCAHWTAGLELLREHAVRHVAGELRLAPCRPGCLICGEIEWQTT